MRLVSTIKRPKHSVFFFLIFGSLCASAQQNSPFSRFGLGDMVPSGNLLNRAMGGVSAPYADGQSINFVNPASYSRLNLVTFDVGLTIDNRTLKSANPLGKYNAVNFTPSYLLLGLPLSSDKQRKNKRTLGLVAGLRPVSSINYSIIEGRKLQLTNADSVVYLYEGSGGLNEAFVGIGKRWGDFSIGINAGYTFGRKETGTRTFIVDTSASPSYRSLSSSNTSFGGGFINGGFQYEGKVTKRNYVRLGASGNLGQKLNAQQDVNRQTFFYNNGGTSVPLDSIVALTNVKGTVQLPSTFSAGVMVISKLEHKSGYTIDDRMIGIEFSSTNWSNYRFYNNSDNLVNSWQLKVGGQIMPKPFDNNFWNNVSYRAGVNIGKDYITAQGKDYNTTTFSIGAGIPVRNWRNYDRQTTLVNTTFEFGKRGNKANNITENFFRFSLGLNLSDVWFIKRKYD